jgi:P27 family predicted phage terminase small subunit
MAPSGKLDPPAHLSEEMQRLWTQIVEENAIDAAAVPILLTYCEARDRREEARAAMKEKGPIIKDRFGVEKMSPWVAIERDSTLIMHRAFRLLGFDQEARGGGDQAKLFG